MTRLPRNPAEAVGELDLPAGASVLMVGPDHGFVEGVIDAVGSDGSVVVQAPPPDLEAPDDVEVVDELPDGADWKVVVGWMGVVALHGVRELSSRVAPEGRLWLVLPKVDRESRAPITEGELKRAMLPLGWRPERTVNLSTDAFAVRFGRRRTQRE